MYVSSAMDDSDNRFLCFTSYKLEGVKTTFDHSIYTRPDRCQILLSKGSRHEGVCMYIRVCMCVCVREREREREREGGGRRGGRGIRDTQCGAIHGVLQIWLEKRGNVTPLQNEGRGIDG